MRYESYKLNTPVEGTQVNLVRNDATGAFLKIESGSYQVLLKISEIIDYINSKEQAKSNSDNKAIIPQVAIKPEEDTVNG